MTTTSTIPTAALHDQALASIPGYADLVAARKSVEARIGDLRGVPTAVLPHSDIVARRTHLAEHLAELAAAGQPFPDDLIDQAVALAHPLLDDPGFRAARAVDVLTETLRALNFRTGQAVQAGVDHALTFLHVHLLDLLEHVRATADPDKLDTLVARYHAIRVSQGALTKLGRDEQGDNPGDTVLEDLATLGAFRRWPELDPRLARRIGLGHDPHGLGPDGYPLGPDPRLALVAPWPAPDDTRDRTWPTLDRPAFLRWAATVDTGAWVPRLDQLAEAMADYRHAATEHAATAEERRRRRVQQRLTGRSSTSHGPLTNGVRLRLGDDAA